MIDLQCRVGFCSTTTWTSRKYISSPTWAFLPPPGLSQSTLAGLPAFYSSFPLAIYFIPGSVDMSAPLSQFVPFPSFPCCVHNSILYVCVSTPALQIGSPVTIFLATKRSKFESVELRWMNLEPVTQSEGSQKEENECRILMHTYAFNECGLLGDAGKSTKPLCACLL